MPRQQPAVVAKRLKSHLTTLNLLISRGVLNTIGRSISIKQIVDTWDIAINIVGSEYREHTWHLDTYIRLDGEVRQDLILINPTLNHPCDRWYNLTVVIADGKATSYVDGVQQFTGELPYREIAEGITSIGVRQNKKSWFDGDLYRIRITPRALTTEEFLTDHKTLNEEYAGKNPVFVGVLKGVVMFFADMVREITVPCEIDFMAVSSYGAGTTSSGEVKMLKDLDKTINGKHVIIVEDIIDSGNTLSYLKRLLEQRNPNSVKICTLLDKPERRKVDLKADYVGFVIPDEFVVGYGLDYDEKYRTYDEVYILKREVYEK